MTGNEPSPEVEGPQFNLLDEPWIAALDVDGQVVEVSILDAFRRSHELREIVGEVPTQSFAILRLLLAVLHRAVQGPTDSDHWQQIRHHWDSGVIADIERYAAQVHDRFWLRHPTQPFYQVAGLHNQRNEAASLAIIISDGPGSSSYLTTRLGHHLERIGWAEAARWLVHTHAYDFAGVHTGAVGDPRVSGGRGFPIGPGWVGQLGGTQLVGATLKETLLLNLVAPSTLNILCGEEDLPVWERSPQTALPEGWPEGTYSTKDRTYREPTGIIDVLTWQSRRILLVGEDEVVTGVVNAQGDRLLPQNRQRLETMTAWRFSEPQTKKFGRPTYMPQELNPAKSLWRGLASLLPYVEPPSAGKDQARTLPPAVLAWVAKLQNQEAIDDRIVIVRAVGAEYINNQTAIGAIIDDKLALPLALLADTEGVLTQAAIEAVECADSAVYALGSLAVNVTLAAGGSIESDGPRDRATEKAFSELDSRFRSWIVAVDANADQVALTYSWQSQVRDILEVLAGEILADAGPTAIVGRVAGGRFIDAGLAEKYFRKKLRDLLPGAYPLRSDLSETAEPDNTQEVA